MERVSQREHVAAAIDCQREMRLQNDDMAATIRSTREAITDSQALLVRTDILLARLV